AEQTETALDAIVLQGQATGDLAGRAVAAPVNDPVPQPAMALPVAATRQGGIMGFDGAGRPSVGGNLALLLSLLASGWSPALSNISWVAAISGLRALTPPGSTA